MTEENTLTKCSRCRATKADNYFSLNSKGSLYKTCDSCRSYRKPKNGEPLLEELIIPVEIIVPVEPVEPIEVIEPVVEPVGLIRYHEDDDANRKINALLKLPKNRTKSDQKVLKDVSKFQQETFLKILRHVEGMGGRASVCIKHRY
jgi:hypothetical protein